MTKLRRCSPEIERELHDKEARIRELEAALRDVDEGLLYYVIGIPHLDTPAKMHRLRIKHLLSAAPPDSESAEGEGSDRVPQCSCTTKTPDWRHHDVGCNYRIYMEDSFPPQREGEPTVRKSLHGGYVWTYCDECGPDVKVDEDGLCLACGGNAVYFGKEPDDTTEQQDAMLERREALAIKCPHCNGEGGTMYDVGREGEGGETCPVCEKGTLTRIECCICDNCDADPVLPDQIRRNDARLLSRIGSKPVQRQDKMQERREQAEGLLREDRLCLLDDKRVGNLCHRIDDHFGERDE